MNVTKSGAPCRNWGSRSKLTKIIEDEDGNEKEVPMNFCRNGNGNNKLNTRKKVSFERNLYFQ